MNRRSKREVWKEVESLGGSRNDHPVASLAILLSADEIQSTDRGLLNIDGELYRRPRESLTEVFGV